MTGSARAGLIVMGDSIGGCDGLGCGGAAAWKADTRSEAKAQD